MSNSIDNLTQDIPSVFQDYQIEDHGSIWLFRPLNDDCRTHLEENTGSEAQWFGGGLVVEPRYVEGLVSGLADNGFYCQLNS